MGMQKKKTSLTRNHWRLTFLQSYLWRIARKHRTLQWSLRLTFYSSFFEASSCCYHPLDFFCLWPAKDEWKILRQLSLDVVGRGRIAAMGRRNYMRICFAHPLVSGSRAVSKKLTFSYFSDPAKVREVMPTWNMQFKGAADFQMLKFLY